MGQGEITKMESGKSTVNLLKVLGNRRKEGELFI